MKGGMSGGKKHFICWGQPIRRSQCRTELYALKLLKEAQCSRSVSWEVDRGQKGLWEQIKSFGLLPKVSGKPLVDSNRESDSAPQSYSIGLSTLPRGFCDLMVSIISKLIARLF